MSLVLGCYCASNYTSLKESVTRINPLMQSQSYPCALRTLVKPSTRSASGRCLIARLLESLAFITRWGRIWHNWSKVIYAFFFQNDYEFLLAESILMSFAMRAIFYLFLKYQLRPLLQQAESPFWNFHSALLSTD